MVESGIHKADKTEFTECWNMTWKQPYILRLALSAGIGGLLFGYDTGVISGALLYIRDDFDAVNRSTFLQEIIVSMAVVGAIFGAAIGGWMNDALGRRPSILIADVLFFIGAAVMAFAPAPWVIIVGRVFVGLGVGMASMTSPLYISEASPAKIRGALVSTNGLLITGGQFLSYLINTFFTKVNGTWRWMLGIAGAPALIQFILMWSLPESPRWLYRHERTVEAVAILKKIYEPHEVEREVEALKASILAEKEEEIAGGGSDTVFGKICTAWSSRAVRRGLYAGIGLQVAQQFVGINTVMYYSPTIVQLAGIASNSVALQLSLITSAVNAGGSVVSILCVDRFGRRKLLLTSMIGIIICLFSLTALFKLAADNAPPVSSVDTMQFRNSTCSAYTTAPNAASWSCTTCLQASSGCGFCAHQNKAQPGACLTLSKIGEQVCRADHRTWYSKGCPSGAFAYLALMMLAVYIISYSPGMGTIPWVVNSEIYPLKLRGTCGGMAAVANWTSNFIVSVSFLSLTKALGSAYTFMLFGFVSMLALVFIFFMVPETKGLQFEEVERMLEDPDMKCWKKYSQEVEESK